MTKRMPGPCCVLCDKPLEETGGVRLIWAGSFGVTLRSIQDALGSIKHPARTIRLEAKYRDILVVFFGKWSDEAIERTKQVAQKGMRPWFCQQCVWKAICPKCGEPMRPVGGADVLGDDGKVRHAFAISGMATRCRNPSCDDFAGEG
jgi:hypothetical protein